MGRRERPVNPAAGVLPAFAADLRRLRSAAGGPTYRELAQRASFSASALSAAASGKGLPSLPVTTAYVGACGGDVIAWERRWKAVHAVLQADRSPPYPRDPPAVPHDTLGRGAPGRQPALPPEPVPRPVPLKAGPDGVRTHLLNGMSRYWIDAILHPSLSTAGRLPVRLAEYRSDKELAAVRIAEAGAAIQQVFARSPHLLILGEPGTGKTTLLLELARELIAACRPDPDRPVPVVVPLSSWAERRHPLADWLVAEMFRLYGMDSQVAASWVAERRVLPLLDGLDRVPDRHRAACVEAINEYQGGRGAIFPLVVTCRTAAYRALRATLRPRIAVEVQRFTVDQVRDYLAAAGPHYADVRDAVARDPLLAEFVTTPAFFTALNQRGAGDGLASPLAEAVGAGAPLRDVVAALVARRLQSDGRSRLELDRQLASCTDDHVSRCLGWLARTIRRLDLPAFHPDRLRLGMLTSRMRRRLVGPGGAAAVGLTALALVGTAMGFAVRMAGPWQAGSGRPALAVGMLAGAVAAAVCAREWLAAAAEPPEPIGPRWIYPSMVRWATWGLGGALLGLSLSRWTMPAVANEQASLSSSLVMGELWSTLDTAPGMAVAGLVVAAVLAPGATRSRGTGRHGRPLGLWVAVAAAAGAYGLLMVLPLLGSLALLAYGQRALQHLLRAALTSEGAMPRNYRQLLQYARTAVLLDEASGAYRFSHPLFREYFDHADELPARPDRIPAGVRRLVRA